MSIVTTKRKRRDCFLTVYFLEVYPMAPLLVVLEPVRGSQIVGKARKRRARAAPPLPSFLPLFFSGLRFLNSADQTI